MAAIDPEIATAFRGTAFLYEMEEPEGKRFGGVPDDGPVRVANFATHDVGLTVVSVDSEGLLLGMARAVPLLDMGEFIDGTAERLGVTSGQLIDDTVAHLSQLLDTDMREKFEKEMAKLEEAA